MRFVRSALVIGAIVASACGGENASGQEYTVAFLRAVSSGLPTTAVFVDELRQAGFVPGRNLRLLASDGDIVYPDPEQARAAVAEWRAADVDIIVAFSSGGAAIAAEGAPDAMVLFVSNDPTANGLVRNERAPEGRLTGFAFRVPADRLLDLADRAVPEMRAVGLVYPRDDAAGTAHRDSLQRAADAAGLVLLAEEFDDEADLRTAVESLASRGADALVVSSSPAATLLLEATQEAATQHGLPLVAATGLASSAIVSLAPDSEEMARQLGRQAARLLSGSPPSAIPVEEPRRFVLTVNASVAAELGIDLPDELIREAQQVIE